MENIKEAKILHGNPKRFTQAESESRYYAERPMALNAWTQTTDNVFSLNNNNFLELPKACDHAVNLVQVVCNKIRILEECFRLHVDFLIELCGHIQNDQSQVMQHHIETADVLAKKNFPPPQHQQSPSPLYQQQIPTPQQQQIPIPSTTVINMGIAEENPTISATDNHLMITSADSDRLESCVEEEEIPDSLSMQHVECTVNVVTEKPLSSSSLNLQAPHGSQNRNILTVSNINDIKIETINTKKPKRKIVHPDNAMVCLGPNNTHIRASIYENIKWNSYSNATRKLLMVVFGKEILGTHSLSGRPSPAFNYNNRPIKGMLDQLKIQDIIFAVKCKTGASEKEIRNIITTKCADQNKVVKSMVKQNVAVNDKENKTIN